MSLELLMFLSNRANYYFHASAPPVNATNDPPDHLPGFTVLLFPALRA